jgi:hypothetical protein
MLTHVHENRLSKHPSRELLTRTGRDGRARVRCRQRLAGAGAASPLPPSRRSTQSPSCLQLGEDCSVAALSIVIATHYALTVALGTQSCRWRHCNERQTRERLRQGTHARPGIECSTYSTNTSIFSFIHQTAPHCGASSFITPVTLAALTEVGCIYQSIKH